MLRFVFFAGVIGAATFLPVQPAHAASPAGARDLGLPAKFSVNPRGAVDFDKAKWTLDSQHDGSDLYTLKDKVESKVAVLHASSGELESVTAYKLAPTETATTWFYADGRLKASSNCDDRKDIGRVCVTATPQLCADMKESNVTSASMKETDDFEMRALAVLLTLRGSDHQLDNMAKSGNRLGLKTALQTTKGQLLRLSAQIAKETAIAGGKKPEPMNDAAVREDKLARAVIEASLPKLKEACAEF